MMKQKMILIRGLPGSGKSTEAAKIIKDHAHFEADMFFMVDGKYCYDKSKIRQAHEWCQEQTLAALKKGKNVIVSNTFTRRVEMKPYFKMAENIGGIDVEVIEMKGNWKNVHDVPEETIEIMRSRWES